MPAAKSSVSEKSPTSSIASARHAFNVRRSRRYDLRLPRPRRERFPRQERACRSRSDEVKSIAAILLITGSAFAQTLPISRVAEDARVVDRVAEVSKRDLP